MIHFFCSTPLQIYTSVILGKTEFVGEQKIIYILNYFNDCEKYLDRIEKFNLFEEVRFVKAWSMYGKLKKREKGFLNYLGYNIYYYSRYAKVLDEYNIVINENDRVFFSYLEPICLMIAKLNKRKKLNIHFLGFEDGIGAYLLPLDRKPNKIEKVLGCEPYYKKECYWVYRPEYIAEESRNNTVVGIQYKIDDDVRNTLLGIWSDYSGITDKSRCIFFDDVITDKDLYNTIEILRDYKDYITVKKHPRRMDHFYEKWNFAEFEPQSIPFEAVVTNSNVSDRVLINYFSSAVLNVIFEFDQRPTLIFLFELVDDPMYKEKLDDLRRVIDYLKDIYEDKNKIIVPHTYEELRNIMNDII